jgi:hypothetical protein
MSDLIRKDVGYTYYISLSHSLINLPTDAWGNEDLIERDHSETFQLPSDIKPGLYVFRTELLALHGNRVSSSPTLYSGPQFYPHCFNVEITGNGNVVPEGVTFPGGYKRDDPGVAFRLYPDEKAWDNYVSLYTPPTCILKLIPGIRSFLVLLCIGVNTRVQLVRRRWWNQKMQVHFRQNLKQRLPHIRRKKMIGQRML